MEIALKNTLNQLKAARKAEELETMRNTMFIYWYQAKLVLRRKQS